MGYSLSWFAVRDLSPETVLTELGLDRTGEREDVPEAALTSLRLKTHWFIVIMNEPNKRLLANATSHVSQMAELLTCYVEEHVMHSACSFWKDGHKLWSVEHEAQLHPNHLTISGNPPAELGAIQQRLVNESGVDKVFEVPIEIARLVTGFRHDEDMRNGEAFPFEVLTLSGSKNSWLKGMFAK